MIGNEGYEKPIDEETARYICNKECNEEWCFFKELARRDSRFRETVEGLPRHSGDKEHCPTREFILREAPNSGEKYSRRAVVQDYFVSIFKYDQGLSTWNEGLMKWVVEGYSKAFRKMWPSNRDIPAAELNKFYEEVRIGAEKIRARESPLIGVLD